MKKLALVGLVSALLFPAISHAQGLGSILGTVTDPTGAAIASSMAVSIAESLRAMLTA